MRDRVAKVAYRVAIRTGVQIDFKNFEDAAYVTLWGHVVSSSQQTGLARGGSDTSEIVVSIPRQTNFPPTAFKAGALIRYPKSSGVIFEVEEIKPDNEDINQASTFLLSCGRFTYCTTEIDT